MGNTLSEEEDIQDPQNAVNLESPEADSHLNSGTSAPNCQPRHTDEELKKGQKLVVEEGLEVVMKDNDANPEVHLQDGTQAMSAKHRRGSSVSDGDGDRRKRQHMSQQQQQQQKKLTYVQMAKLGYQELVNAIIRPPRADYKVCHGNSVVGCSHCLHVQYYSLSHIHLFLGYLCTRLKPLVLQLSISAGSALCELTLHFEQREDITWNAPIGNQLNGPRIEL